MSLWIPKKEKDGTWSYFQVPLFLVFLAFNVIGILITIVAVVIMTLLNGP